jgi:hypothetical protein
MELWFEIENLGNTDVELLFAEVTVSMRLKSSDWEPKGVPNQIDRTIRGPNSPTPMYNVRYWTHPGAETERLVPVLTRSMGPITLKELRIKVTQLDDLSNERTFDVSFQLHVRGYDTRMETLHINHIERHPRPE